MKPMTCKDIQKVSLEILKDVHHFCIKHHITYFLDSGTLLGAIRHNGFIPWDDDIDIIMPRPEYEKFCKLYESEKRYKLFCYERDNCYIAFSRVCDMEKTFVNASQYPWSKEETGVWIDIFPFDGINNNEQKAKEQIAQLMSEAKKLTYYRGCMTQFNDAKGIIKLTKLLIKKLFFCHSSTLTNYIALCKQENYGDSNQVGNLACILDNCVPLHKRELLNETILHKFEDTEFCIMSKFDEILTCYYGDYMQLPPEEDRVGKHGQNQYYWK